MPLVMITGYPVSGKSRRASQLRDFFLQRIAEATDAPTARLKVHIVNSESLDLSHDVYHSAKSEKNARAAEYSAVKRLLSRDAIVILDALNYIKGFRYQLFCEAKALQTTSCVVHVGTPSARCRDMNSARIADASTGKPYALDVFENLIYRYEEPNGMSRWDSPLFTVLYEDDCPPYERIWDALVGKEGTAKVVRPNQATVLKPATDEDYLYELDKATSDILNVILSWQRDHPGEAGEKLAVGGTVAQICLPPTPVSLPQLQRLRRQFLNLNRQHHLTIGRTREIFVDFLNVNLQQ